MLFDNFEREPSKKKGENLVFDRDTRARVMCFCLRLTCYYHPQQKRAKRALRTSFWSRRVRDESEVFGRGFLCVYSQKYATDTMSPCGVDPIVPSPQPRWWRRRKHTFWGEERVHEPQNKRTPKSFTNHTMCATVASAMFCCSLFGRGWYGMVEDMFHGSVAFGLIVFSVLLFILYVRACVWLLCVEHLVAVVSSWCHLLLSFVIVLPHKMLCSGERANAKGTFSDGGRALSDTSNVNVSNASLAWPLFDPIHLSLAAVRGIS